MPDQSHVGRRYQASGQVVEAAAAVRFAEAVAGDAEVADLGPVPPTFAAVYCLFPTLGQLFLDPELELDLTGLVHGEQSFDFESPVHPGDVIDASAEIAAVESKRGRVFVTVTMEAVRPADGARVCSGRALLLVAAGTPS